MSRISLWTLLLLLLLLNNGCPPELRAMSSSVTVSGPLRIHKPPRSTRTRCALNISLAFHKSADAQLRRARSRRRRCCCSYCSCNLYLFSCRRAATTSSSSTWVLRHRDQRWPPVTEDSLCGNNHLLPGERRARRCRLQPLHPPLPLSLLARLPACLPSCLPAAWSPCLLACLGSHVGREAATFAVLYWQTASQGGSTHDHCTKMHLWVCILLARLSPGNVL